MNIKKLKKFADNSQEEAIKNNDDSKILDEKSGLIERIDVKLVTKNGKQLLKEQLYESN